MRTLLLILVSSTALGCTGCYNRPDPAAFIDHYVDLHNSGDVEGLLALHASDSEFLLPGQKPIRGTAALRDLFEWDAVLGSDLTMEDVTARGDTIVIDSVMERNKWFEAIGLPEVHYKPGTRLVLRNGLITGTYPTGFDDETKERVVEQIGDIVIWMSANRPEALKQLMPGGTFRYNASSARLWLEVLDEWNSARQ